MPRARRSKLPPATHPMLSLPTACACSRWSARSRLSVKWRAIIGQRNIIAHEYGSIDHPRLLETVMRDLPALVTMIEALLPPSVESDDDV